MRMRRFFMSRALTMRLDAACALFVFASRRRSSQVGAHPDACVSRSRRHRVLSQRRRTSVPDGSRRHDARLRGVCDVPHLADERAVQPRNARDRRGMDLEQSRRNFDVVTKLVNTADPESSRLLRKPLTARPAVWAIRAEPTGVAERSRIPRALEVDPKLAGGQVRRGGRADARLRVLSSLRPARVRDPSRRSHPLQQLPFGRPHRLRAGAAERQLVVRRRSEAGVPDDHQADHPRQSRAEPLSVEAAASRRRRVVHAQRAAALAVA